MTEQVQDDNYSEKNTIKQEAKEYIERIDKDLMNRFRDLLFHYIEILSTDYTEIADGLGVSRPTLTKFMDGCNELPLSVGSIRHLHKVLSDPEQLNKPRRRSNKAKISQSTSTKDREKFRQDARDNRTKLQKEGADRLLIAAGFQTSKKVMLPVSPLQYSQLSSIVFLYEERPISQDLFFQITERAIDNILDSHNKNSIEEELSKRIDDNHWMSDDEKNNINKKYKQAKSALEKYAKTLSQSEQVELFTSILHNELQVEKEIGFKLRIISIEQIPLSLPWREEENDLEVKNLQGKIKENIKDCESELGNELTKGSEKDLPRLKYPVHSLTRTIVTCREGEQGGELKFEYISTDTHIGSAISALSLNMGFHRSREPIKFEIKCLEEDIQSLVKASVRIGKEDQVLGQWVSGDIIEALLQAMTIAARKWLYKKIESDTILELYKETVKNTSKLRTDFYKQRIAFDGYDFNDNRASVGEFEKIEERAAEYIEKIENTLSENKKNIQSDMWSTFRSNFDRILIGSQIYMLHHSIIQANHTESEKWLKKIDKHLGYEVHDDRTLIPSQIAFEAEKIAYNLAFGIPWQSDNKHSNSSSIQVINLLESNNILSDIEKIYKRIEYFLDAYKQRETFSNEPGYDIHYGLGSYHSIVGRILFYTADSKKEIRHSCQHFFKAIYYFKKIGLSRKVERNLALAGRVKVRSKQIEYASPCKKLSEILLKENINKINALIDPRFELSMKSRLNSLEGEYSLIIDRDREKSLESCLKALKGSLWLGLNRHIADNLYTISRCAEVLGLREIKDDLKKEFSDLWNSKESECLAHYIAEPQKNPTAKTVIFELWKIANNTESFRVWSDAEELLRDTSAKIWTAWYQEATKSSGEHPFAVAMKKDKRERRFLESIDR
jgi:hypothetical protein